MEEVPIPFGPIILHANSASDTFVERLKDGLSRQAGVDRTEHVQVPSVVIGLSRLFAAAHWAGRYPWLEYRAVINSGAQHQQITNGGFSLRSREAGFVVVDAQVSQRAIQANSTLSDSDAVEGSQQRRLNGPHVHGSGDIPPGRDYVTVMHDHYGCGPVCLEKRFCQT